MQFGGPTLRVAALVDIKAAPGEPIFQKTLCLNHRLEDWTRLN
jgi:hypothetical protein